MISKKYFSANFVYIICLASWTPVQGSRVTSYANFSLLTHTRQLLLMNDYRNLGRDKRDGTEERTDLKVEKRVM